MFQNVSECQKNLLKSQKSSNETYSDFILGFVSRLGNVEFTSEVVTNSENPEWNQEFQFLIDEVLQGHKIKMEFFDQDTFASDDFLGFVEKVLDGIPNNEIESIKLKNHMIETEVSCKTTY